MSLALIAGEGDLPVYLVKALDRAGTPFRYCEVEGHSSEARGDRPMQVLKVENLGSFIAELKSQGVSQVCFAGKVARPKIDPSEIDAATAPLVPRMMAALQAGDDKALRLLLSFFEDVGIDVLAAQHIAPELVPKPGVLGSVEPTEQDREDAIRGKKVLAAMSAADVGQACIIANGQALALEAIGGTDWMMRSLMGKKGNTLFDDDHLRDPELPAGGVLIKSAKLDQDMRIDMPVIGPDTVIRASVTQLRGIVIEAGRVMLLDPERCVELADQAGLFLWAKG